MTLVVRQIQCGRPSVLRLFWQHWFGHKDFALLVAAEGVMNWRTTVASLSHWLQTDTRGFAVRGESKEALVTRQMRSRDTGGFADTWWDSNSLVWPQRLCFARGCRRCDGLEDNGGFFVSFAANMTLAVSQWGRKQEAKQGCAPVTLAVSQTHGGTATW